MTRLIDADTVVTIQVYNDMTEETDTKKMTIAEAIDEWSDEGCPPTANADEFEWCHDCKEYDQNAHCCHRWTKVIRNTVDGLLAQGYERVRHGHWNPLEADGYADGNPVVDLWECSVCGEEHEGEEHTLTPYCPWCGARLEVEDATEE